MSHIDLDEIANVAEAELADARQMCHDNCPPHCTDWVRVSIEAHALLAMVRALRAVIDLRPPPDQSILGASMAVDQRVVGEFNAALAPFRKGGA